MHTGKEKQMNASYQASLVNRHIRRFTGLVLGPMKNPLYLAIFTKTTVTRQSQVRCLRYTPPTAAMAFSNTQLSDSLALASEPTDFLFHPGDSLAAPVTASDGSWIDAGGTALAASRSTRAVSLVSCR